MPRPSRFNDDDVLDAARWCVHEYGPAATIGEVAERLGGPVGSIYHRFASREELVARLWLRSIRRFQAPLFTLAERTDPHEALVEMALHVPRYCRAHPDEARALTLHRHQRLLENCPPGLEADVRELNVGLDALTRSMTTRRFGNVRRRSVELVVLATRVSPYGLVRPHLGSAVPPVVDEAVAAATDAILRLGDG